MSEWDLLLTDADVATMRAGADGYGVIEKAAVAIHDGRIAWIGAAADLPASAGAAERRSLDGRWITPALIDCHTHLVFAGDRADEYERRLAGESYASIAAGGGGIRATVAATRAAEIDDLYNGALRRLRQLAQSGVATVEIKSGYGMDSPTGTST